ncbi:FtsX-like permease family protein [candidate division KSB1 bacterium]|nr:FtsX-like permease family protein [candidate division KSB1 bacterium]
MILFIIKGLLRDHSRSFFPLLIVVVGVILTVFAYAWLQGVESDFIFTTARFSTGHVRVMSRAYAAEVDQIPNDLALLNSQQILTQLKTEYPDLRWTARIKFGGLLDIPDENRETRCQAPIMGMAIDLLTAGSSEIKILNIPAAIVQGKYPTQAGELLIGDELAQRLQIKIGEKATLISSTMYGSMSFTNFIVVGTIRFGVGAMDRGALLADITDIQQTLEMDDATGEMLGFFKDDIYNDEIAQNIAQSFNVKYAQVQDEFAPVMGTFREQSGLADYMDLLGGMSKVMLVIFVGAMSIVLWNAGLMGSLRRYGEIGVRLAIGEDKIHLYRSLIAESMVIGGIGSIIGTGLGLAFGYYLQYHGIEIGSMMKNSTLMISDVIRARVTPACYGIGFVPGFLATFLGTAISGIGIFKRQTAQLFKELEV